MKIIETILTVLPDGSVEVAPLPVLPPGRHRAVLVIDNRAEQEAMPKPPLELRILNLNVWPADAAFRREEMYGDDGR